VLGQAGSYDASGEAIKVGYVDITGSTTTDSDILVTVLDDTLLPAADYDWIIYENEVFGTDCTTTSVG
jgi:hypothetical protein